MAFSKIFQGKNDQAKNYIQWMLTSDIFENLNDTSKYIAILTLAMEYANQNRLDAFNKGIQEFGQKDFSIASNEDLGKAVISTGLDKSYFENMGKKLKNAGFWIYGADAGGETLGKISFPKKTCLIMGSEGSGISNLLQQKCDSIVSIPTCGKIDSLNVSVAAGVLLYELFARQNI